MKLFEDIKDGNIPDKEVVFFLLENEITDDNIEIPKYIKILKNSLNNSKEMEEKLLLIRVIFVLEMLNN